MAEYTAEQAFASFIDRLAEDIESPDAILIEAQHHLSRLSELVDSREWVQDEQGNIFPASLSEAEQNQIGQTCAFSIIDEIPKVVDGFPTNVSLCALGSLVFDVTVVVNYPNTQSVSFDLFQSTAKGTVLTVGDESHRQLLQ